MKTATIKASFGDKHKEYISRAIKATISVAEGAVRAGKTVDNIAAFAYMIDRGVPDRIHLATGSTSANAKLNIGDANGLGLEYIFRGRCRWTKYKGNEALIIKSHGRNYVVIFAGAAKADSYKKIRGNSYGMWIATEINLHHEDTIKEAFNRQLAAKVRKVFWDLNPSAPGAWIYKNYIDRFESQYNNRYNYQHFTIRDNATITAQRLAEIEAQYDTNSIWYKRDILGQRCIAEGLVYPMFGPDCIVEPITEPCERYVISMDYGIQNPTAMILWGKQGDTWYALKEFYHSGRETGSQKTDQQYYEELEKLAGDLPIDCLIVDPSATSFIALVRQNHRFKVRKAINDVVDGIQKTAACLSNGKIKICACCERSIQEFGLYSWDDKAVEDTPIKENDHAMDAIRYFVNTMGIWRQKSDYTPLWN